MKKIYTLCAAILLTACSHSNPNSNHSTSSGHNSHTTETPSMHIGEISSDKLLQHYQSFATEYSNYQVDMADAAKVRNVSITTEIVILFGTWCHDSQREVPRMLKLLEKANNTNIKVSLIAVDYSKQEPKGIAQSHGLKYTPTFVIRQYGKEVGRIIEKPEKSLAADLIKYTTEL